MEIIHVSAECYPVAKVGGLGDVVGALPKYQCRAGYIAKVVMPMYRTRFLYENEWELVHQGATSLGERWFEYNIIKEKTNKLGFDLYLLDIHNLLDREKVYSYDDDTERFTSFQIAVMDWMVSWKHLPDIIHVHDHHTALIPFMAKYCFAYRRLAAVPTVLTIHNAQYQGWMGWDKSHYIPHWDGWRGGMLDWNNTINPLASGIKCAWKVTTVSWSYLEELRWMSNGLEALFEYEKGKCIGIINGIDTKVWDPLQDNFLEKHYALKTADEGKLANKKLLCDAFHLDINKPLFIFIGRLVGEKAADLLPSVIRDSVYHMQARMNFLVLGSGEAWVEHQLESMRGSLTGYYNARIGYNEQLSHQMYAGADFLLMPSRVEPCGLNQLYAMRYGTIPVVRRTGGLIDTVKDFGEPGGYGVCFSRAETGDITHAIYRALELYENKSVLKSIRKTIMRLDHSWDKSAAEYIHVYESFKPLTAPEQVRSTRDLPVYQEKNTPIPREKTTK